MNEYLDQALRLTVDFVSTRSVGLVLRDRAGNTGTGSSTCIRIGSHYLLATAGHVIEDLNDSRIQLIPAGVPGSTPLRFLGRSCFPGQPAPATDVAWLELESPGNLLRFIELSDLLPGQQLDRGRPFVVHGYPYETAVIQPVDSDLESTAALTMMAQPTELPRALQAHEIALEWPPRDEQGQPQQRVPHPRGVSGGGTWRHTRSDEHAIFTPERFRLVGVNLSWDPPSSILFAARIEHWLHLVRADFPDTSDEISAVLSDQPP